MKKNNVIIRNLGLKSWENIFIHMNHFTNIRNKNTLDEIWFVEHYPVFTKGQIEYNQKISYIHNIPVMHSNRGGKITYHGPGQQIVYFLLDVRRLKINIKKLLFLIEQVVLNTLHNFCIFAYRNTVQPGIYVNNKKICSIGLRIKKGCCLHGFALNVNINLNSFKYIYPCGDNKIIMTKISDIKQNINFLEVQEVLKQQILLLFNMHCILFLY